jgi:manganese transport protein
MSQHYSLDNSLNEVHESVDVTSNKKGIRKFLPYIGPAYLVSVGYMDPGNWATDLQGGAQFGYKLIWVLLMSNLMALLLQSLSARLGIVRRRDLAQANRETYPPLINFCLYILAELAIAACDLAEVLGMAIGLHLLTGISILLGVCITVLDTFLLLVLQRYGIRRMEAFIIVLVATIGISFIIELIFAQPQLGAIASGFIPTPLSGQSLYIAIGIIGATVMPHNLYLHSALVQTRKIKNDDEGIRRALKFNFIDTTIALNLAFFVNAAILILAASVFYTTGLTHVAKIEEAYRLLPSVLGTKLSQIIFAVALIAAGQSSTITGTLAGQIVMEGYLRIRINPWMRRLLTRLIAIVPAVIVITIYGEDKLDDLLVFSQVILSMQLGFAVIPLIHFVSDRSTMGAYAIRLPMKILSWIIAFVLVSLNMKLLIEQVIQAFQGDTASWVKTLIVLGGMVFSWLFFSMTLLPVFRKKKHDTSVLVHGQEKPLQVIPVPSPQRIAITVDFGVTDEKTIAYALAQGKKDAVYILLHVVETASTALVGSAADDYETRDDKNRLLLYADQLISLGYHVESRIGYRNRVEEIVRIVNESKADLLVMGSHQHTGIKDILYGETVDQVRHRLSIPVLIVN